MTEDNSAQPDHAVRRYPRVDEFILFAECLTVDASEGYTPWFFRCAKGGKKGGDFMANNAEKTHADSEPSATMDTTPMPARIVSCVSRRKRAIFCCKKCGTLVGRFYRTYGTKYAVCPRSNTTQKFPDVEELFAWGRAVQGNKPNRWKLEKIEEHL